MTGVQTCALPIFASAEALVTALDGGILGWREFVNPRSEYNVRKRAGK